MGAACAEIMYVPLPVSITSLVMAQPVSAVAQMPAIPARIPSSIFMPNSEFAKVFWFFFSKKNVLTYLLI
jgi:hypothetical protein